MTATGWTGEPPEDAAPALPQTSMLLANGRGQQQPGAVLAQAQAQARAQEARDAIAAAASAPDPDERAANLVSRGVMPGMISGLSRQLGDTMAELEGEREKIERGRRRSERAMKDHAAGRLTAWDLSRMDLDEGDQGTVERLERRADSLRRQLAEASALLSPRRDTPTDPVEAATRRAHEAFVEATRAKLAEAAAARAAQRSRSASPPKAPPHDPRGCQVCLDYAEGARADHDQPSAREIVR